MSLFWGFLVAEKYHLPSERVSGPQAAYIPRILDSLLMPSRLFTPSDLAVLDAWSPGLLLTLAK